MHGFFIGLAAALGIKWLVSHRRRCRGYGYDNDYEHGRGRRCGRRRRYRRGPGRFGRSVMYRIFERLDTTPGQEKVIRAEIESLIEQARTSKGAFMDSRADLAQALRADVFDNEAANAGVGHQDRALKEMRAAFLSSMARIHEALDPRQREILADLLESGPRMHGGPYRGWA